MIRYFVVFVAVGLCAAWSPGRAAAQYFPQQSYNPQFGTYNPQFQTNLSPFLNILRGNAAVNYYGATLGNIPSMQQNFLNNQFGTSLLDLQRRQALGTLPAEEISLLPGTGHPTAFGTTATYFGSTNPYGPGGSQRSTAPTQGQRPRP